MPAIPLYQQQTTPDGTLNARALPAEGGAEVIRAVGDTLGKVGEVVQREGLRKIQEEKALVQERLKANEDDARFWAARVLSETELTAKAQLENMEVTRAPDDYGIAPQFIQWGEGFVNERLKHAPSPLHRKFAELGMRQLFDRTAARAMDLDKAYESKRMAWNFTQAVDASAKVLQSSDTETLNDQFKEQMGRLGSLMKGVPGSETNRGLNLDPWTRDQLMDKARGDLVMRSGEREIEVDPDEFLRKVGANEEGVPEVQGFSRPTTGPRGIRNFNPGNIRKGDRWQGAVGDDGAFVQFATPEHGVRAMGRVLQSYAKKGANTLASIAARWAPSSDNNDPVKYADTLSQELGGVDKNRPLDLSDEETLTALSGAIIKAEGNAGYLSPEQIKKGVRAALGKEKLGEAPSPERINGAPIEAPSWWQVATAEERDKLLDFGRRASRERAAANMQYLSDWKRNADAAQSSGLAIPPAPSSKDVLAAFAGDTEKATRYYQQNIEPFNQVRRMSAQMSGMTIAEMDQAIAGLQPKAGRTNDPNLAADLQRIDAAKQARTAILNQRSRDPMAQALQQPSVRAHQNDPEKMIAAAMAWQEANVPQGKRSVLLDQHRRELEESWNDPQSTNKTMDKIQELQGAYGQYFDEALLEIAPKAPSDVLLFAGMNADPKTAPARQRIRALAAKSLDEVIVGNEARKKQVVTAVGRVFNPFYSSFKQTNQIEGSKYVENIGDAVVKYAASLTNAGLSPTKAAERAYEEIVASQYGFIDGGRAPSGRAQVRAPRAIVEDEEMLWKVESGLEALKEQAPADLAFPVGVSRADGLDASYWATSANDKGVVMMFNGAPVRVLRDGKLVPFELSWNAVANAGERFQMSR